MMNVNCSESDAILTINGQRYSPPAQVRVKRNRDVAIQAYKDEFVPYQRTIGHHFNGTGALDAVGTLLILVPCVGLFCPGAWSLDETDVFIQLYEKDKQLSNKSMQEQSKPRRFTTRFTLLLMATFGRLQIVPSIYFDQLSTGRNRGTVNISVSTL